MKKENMEALYKDPIAEMIDGRIYQLNVSGIMAKLNNVFLDVIPPERRNEIATDVVENAFHHSEPLENHFVSELIDKAYTKETTFLLSQPREYVAFMAYTVDTYFLPLRASERYKNHLLFIWETLGTVKTAEFMYEIKKIYAPVMNNVLASLPGMLSNTVENIQGQKDISVEELQQLSADFIVDMFTPELRLLEKEPD